MRYVSYTAGGQARLAVRDNGVLFDLGALDLRDILAEGPEALTALAAARRGKQLDEASLRFLPPIARPSKIACIGLNYVDHAAESPYKDVPNYPTIFPRFSSSLIGHGEDIIRPAASEHLDFEGELVAVIGQGGRHISRETALDHVAGYSIFNDGSIRDYQFKSPQWTVGKNFDDTGAFGPDFVTADELPPGGKGLKIQTRLNGAVVQSANTDDMVFPLADLIFYLSEAITLEPGDLIITGTPAGVGFARKPPLYMKNGDVCEVEIEGLGVLRNPVRDEVLVTSVA